MLALGIQFRLFLFGHKLLTSAAETNPFDAAIRSQVVPSDELICHSHEQQRTRIVVPVKHLEKSKVTDVLPKWSALVAPLGDFLHRACLVAFSYHCYSDHSCNLNCSLYYLLPPSQTHCSTALSD